MEEKWSDEERRRYDRRWHLRRREESPVFFDTRSTQERRRWERRASPSPNQDPELARPRGVDTKA